MKLILLAIVLTVCLGSTECEHCVKLSQHSFDYVPMLENNYCRSDYVCESMLRDISFKYLSNGVNPRQSPCYRDPTNKDCQNYSIQICSELLGENCAPSYVRQMLKPNGTNLKEQLNELDNEATEIQQELRSEVTKQKLKFLDIIDKLDLIQNEFYD